MNDAFSRVFASVIILVYIPDSLGLQVTTELFRSFADRRGAIETDATNLVCIDTPNWNNGKNFTCTGLISYESEGWCVDGTVPEDWEWAAGAEYNYPEKNCCICGKPGEVMLEEPEVVTTTKPVEPTCKDTPGWDNGFGFGCTGPTSYANEGWCAGGAVSSRGAWTVGAKYGDPESNCCVCGRRAPTPGVSKDTQSLERRGQLREMSGQSCIAWGDQHITTFDVHKNRKQKYRQREAVFRSKGEIPGQFTIEDAGMFWLVKSKRVRIQAKYKTSPINVSRVMLTGLAIGGKFLKGDVLLIRPFGKKCTWNGQEILMKMPSQFSNKLVKARFHADSTVIMHGKNGPGIDLELPDGVRVTINRWKQSLAVEIKMMPREDGQDGRCGNYNGDASDDTQEHILVDRVADEESLLQGQPSASEDVNRVKFHSHRSETCPGFTKEPHTNYWGDDCWCIPNSTDGKGKYRDGVASPESCSQLCSLNFVPYYTWRSTEGRCWCKLTKGGIKHDPSFYSGHACEVCPGYTVEVDSNIFGGDCGCIADSTDGNGKYKDGVSGPDTCSLLCGDNGAKFYTYRKNDGRCWCKDDDSGRRQQLGFYSGGSCQTTTTTTMSAGTTISNSLQATTTATMFTHTTTSNSVQEDTAPTCVDGDARAAGGVIPVSGQAFYPEVLFDGKWYPVCGHYFWDNNNGATTLCKMLGFLDGQYAKTEITFGTDAMPIGDCYAGEPLTACTGGGNAWGDFSYLDGTCTAGHAIGVTVTCTGGAYSAGCQQEYTAPTCVDGDAKTAGDAIPVAGQAFYPEVLFDGEWYPVCGHYFWDNNNGATTLCKMLGFRDGQYAKTEITFGTDAMPIGDCYADEPLTACTGGGNAWGNLSYNDGFCTAGHAIGVTVTCTVGAYLGGCQQGPTTPSASPCNSPPTQGTTAAPCNAPGGATTTPTMVSNPLSAPMDATTTPTVVTNTFNAPGGATTTPTIVTNTFNAPGGATTTPTMVSNPLNAPMDATTTPTVVTNTFNAPGGATTTPTMVSNTFNAPTSSTPTVRTTGTTTRTMVSSTFISSLASTTTATMTSTTTGSASRSARITTTRRATTRRPRHSRRHHRSSTTSSMPSSSTTSSTSSHTSGATASSTTIYSSGTTTEGYHLPGLLTSSMAPNPAETTFPVSVSTPTGTSTPSTSYYPSGATTVSTVQTTTTSSTSSTPSVCPEYSVEVDTNIFGGDCNCIADSTDANGKYKDGVSGPESCSFLCGDNGAEFYTYRMSDGRCWCKENDIGRRAQPGFYSGGSCQSPTVTTTTGVQSTSGTATAGVQSTSETTTTTRRHRRHRDQSPTATTTTGVQSTSETATTGVQSTSETTTTTRRHRRHRDQSTTATTTTGVQSTTETTTTTERHRRHRNQSTTATTTTGVQSTTETTTTTERHRRHRNQATTTPTAATTPSSPEATTTPTAATTPSSPEATTTPTVYGADQKATTPPRVAHQKATTTTTSAACGAGGQCIIWGDPHIIPFDLHEHRRAQHPDNEALFRTRNWKSDQLSVTEVGTFWLVKSDRVQIQGRYWRNGTHPEFTNLGSLAIGGSFLGGNTLIIRPSVTGNITWNDEAILPHIQSEFNNEFVHAKWTVDSRMVQNGKRGPAIELSFPDGVSLLVNRWKQSLAAQISMCRAQPHQDGQCGNFNGDYRDDAPALILARVGKKLGESEWLFPGGPPRISVNSPSAQPAKPALEHVQRSPRGPYFQALGFVACVTKDGRQPPYCRQYGVFADACRQKCDKIAECTGYYHDANAFLCALYHDGSWTGEGWSHDCLSHTGDSAIHSGHAAQGQCWKKSLQVPEFVANAPQAVFAEDACQDFCYDNIHSDFNWVNEKCRWNKCKGCRECDMQAQYDSLKYSWKEEQRQAMRDATSTEADEKLRYRGDNVSKTCVDTPGWTNGYEFTCTGDNSYESEGWCEGGAVKANMQWSLGQEFNHPERNCCICGKRIQRFEEVPVAAEPALSKTEGIEMPLNPGCYVLTPSGCPQRKGFQAAQAWVKDSEEESDASSSACVARTAVYNKWCGIKDAKMMFVPRSPAEEQLEPSEEQVDPEAKGRRSHWWWPFKPKKSPAPATETELSTAELSTPAPETEMRAAELPTSAPIPESSQEDSSTPESETGMSTEEPALLFPEGLSHGCYVILPSGCPGHYSEAVRKNLVSQTWVRDDTPQAHINSAACAARKRQYDDWCHVIDATVRYVEPAPKEPAHHVSEANAKHVEPAPLESVTSPQAATENSFALVHGVGHAYCADRAISDSTSEGQDDCESRCESTEACNYYSFWHSGSENWCRLTATCAKLQQQRNTISIWGKEIEEMSPQVTTKKDFELFRGVGHAYCNDLAIANSPSEGQDDCESKCETTQDCNYYSFWHSGGKNWCRLTAACEKLQEQAHTISIWEKAPGGSGSPTDMVDVESQTADDARGSYTMVDKVDVQSQDEVDDADEESEQSANAEASKQFDENGDGENGDTAQVSMSHFVKVGDSYCRGSGQADLVEHTLVKDVAHLDCRLQCEAQDACRGYHWQEARFCFLYAGNVRIETVNGLEEVGECYRKI